MALTIKENILVDIFEELVDNIRLTGDISASINQDEFTKITSVDHCLRINELGAITDDAEETIEYLVEEIIDADNFTVTGNDLGTLVSWKALAPFYHHGAPEEVTNVIQSINENNDLKEGFKNYPFVWLEEDFDEDHSNNGYDYIALDLKIVIVMKTLGTYEAGERMENIFKPVLLPIYEALMAEIRRSGEFTMGKGKAKHVKRNHMFYGSDQNPDGSKNKFKDYTDAVEIKNMDLKVNKKKCLSTN